MKLKYYMRGLGIGIAVTAVILSVSVKGKTQAMTDAQIIAKAKELGMTEQTVLSELETGEEKENGEAGNTQNTIAKKDSGQEANAQNADSAGIKPETDKKDSSREEAETGKAETGKTETGKAETGKAETGKAETRKAETGKAGTGKAETGKAETGKAGTEPVEGGAQVEMESTVIVSIYPGEGSYTVSRKLAALGLVESADVYDKFLCQNGYDKKLCTGNYEIRAGAGADEIARILTKGM